jgi:gliding motility-associated protein GldM
MAGGKETPRQKMIGMMYLVLTALLALNISKEIVMAFVKLNDKMEVSNRILDTKVDENITKFENAMSLPQTKASAKPWHERAMKIVKLSNDEVDHLLQEASDLIKEVEGKEWLEVDPKTKKKKLMSLNEIQSKDDYDAATRLFVGGDPNAPIERGVQIRTKLHKLRDEITKIVGNYTEGKKTWVFDPAKVKNLDPNDEKTFASLKEALKTANPIDQSKIEQIYRTLSYPEILKEYDEPTSWQGGMFDHAPVVAAAALFTSLRGDIKAAEVIALDHLSTKLEQPLIKINKIEPLTSARAGYLNQGDSMTLRVMIAAYDSTDVPLIRYSENGAAEQEIKGGIRINASTPGEKEIKGTIGIKQKGELVWKPWSFKYEVGAPTAVVSPLDLTVLYAGYPNSIGATASGYPADKVSLSAPGCELSKSGKDYVVKPPQSMVGKKVNMSVSGKGANGGSKSLGTFEFKVRPLPNPLLFLGGVSNLESSITRASLLNSSSLAAGYDASIPLTKITFAVKSYDIVFSVNGNKVTKTVNGAALPADVKAVFKQLKPNDNVTIQNVKVWGPTGQVRVAAMAFVVK